VGSGCVHSAAGRFFAEETAIGARVVAQAAIDPVFAGTELVDVPVRDDSGQPRASAAVAGELARHVERAAAAGRRAVVHVVHGSKSGLTLPALSDVERLVAAHGDAMTVVVDACQLRIAPAGVRRYLDLGCIVMLTGSKFAGGPPFSGFAFVPAAIRARVRPLPRGLRRIAYRAEWPADWPGVDALDARGNFGLLLRLEAALIEIERFAAVPDDRVAAASARFCQYAADMAGRLGVAEVPGAGGVSCLATQTLRTIDLSARWPDCDLDAARALHAHIARHARRDTGREIRLGQPVRTHRLPDGRSAGTLRLSLSMPLIAEFAALAPAALDRRLGDDMALIERAIAAAADVTLDRKTPVALA
jgi:selenocysteine lyase/cysteine desulfurase